MNSKLLIPLSELECDALGELSNISMARAATSLRKMIEHEVRLSVPSVEILSRGDAAARVLGNNSTLVGVRQDFSGALSGRALLLFPEAGSLELVRLVVGRQLALEDIVELEDEALSETGNIILNSWVATIANLLKQSLKVSLPVVVRGDNRTVFEIEVAGDSLVLFLRIKFEIKQQEVHGYVALLMDVPSIDALRVLVAEYIASVA
jgi:chemotaxis protein CheC